jgi:hypothetical protein
MFPSSVGSGLVRSFWSSCLRSPLPPPPYSQRRTSTTQRSHPPASLYANTLIPSPPCSPTQRASIEWAADPTLQGEAVGRAARTSLRGWSAGQAPLGTGRSTGCCSGPCARHPHHRRTQRLTSTHTALTPASLPLREHSPPLTTLLTHPSELPSGGQLTPHCKVRRWGTHKI